MATPGIPNDYSLSTTCFGSRLTSIQDQIFAAVGMGFRRLELGLSETPPNMEGLEESQRETGVTLPSMVAGCRDPLNGSMAVSRLGSLVTDECERAISAVRRHVRLARAWRCPVVVIRGSKIESADLRKEIRQFEQSIAMRTMSSELAEEIRLFVRRVQKDSQRQIEQLCRSLYTLATESPDVRFALEPGQDLDDLLGFEAMGWVLDDLEAQGLSYWHDVGSIHIREKRGLPGQGAWLDAFGSRLVGVHLQDAAEHEAEMPLGIGEVDFQLIGEYVPAGAERVIEIGPSHGRAEILASVQFLADRGF